MKDFDPEPYARGIRDLNERERRAIVERAALARAEAERLALGIGRADPGVRSVRLFGSLARGEPKSLDFDIDLALEGGDVYAAMDAVADSAFKVDLVQLELLPEGARRAVVADGVVLFAAEGGP